MAIYAYIMINVEVGKLGKVLRSLRDIRGVKNISVVAGEFDIIVRVEVPDLETLFYITEDIHSISGITRTTTHVVEKEVMSE